MNGRVGNALDFVADDVDIDDNLPLPDDYEPDCKIKARNSNDKDVISGHGKDLLRFCKSTKFRIMNGRWEKGDGKGKLTCINVKGSSSTVDYCLIREKTLKLVEEFSIGNLTTYSDHVVLNIKLKTGQHKSESENSENLSVMTENSSGINDKNLNGLCQSYNCRYLFEADSSGKIEMCLGSEKIKQELTILKDKISRQDITIDQAISNLRSILIKISEASLKKINFANDHSKKKTKRKLNEWFDDECRDFKKTVNNNRKRFQEAIRNNYPNTELIRLKSEYFNSLKIFNKIKKRKENNYWKIKKEHLRTLKIENPKDFWRKLKLKHSGIETNFSKAELFNYFSKLASDDTSQVNTAKLQVDPNRTTTTPCESSEALDFQDMSTDTSDKVITVSKIKKVISNMKNGKAAGIDKIVPELIKALDVSTLEIIVHILNSILDSGIFPEEWTVGVIVILYKDGEKSDLNNYRGITLLSMLGKILVGVLNNRLSEFVAQADILLENQCGFRKGYQTSDHILLCFL